MINAIEAWGSAFKTELDKILVLQKRAMRLIMICIQQSMAP